MSRAALWVLLAPLTAVAQVPAPAAVAVAAPAAPAVVGSPLNLVWGLLFLLALVVLAWWLVRRMGGMQWSAGRAIRVLASAPVGPRERVVLIEAGGEQYLLGVAPGRVNLLQRLEQPIATDAGVGAGGDFASKIRAAMQQGLQR